MQDPGASFLEAYFQNHAALQQAKQFAISDAFRKQELSQQGEMEKARLALGQQQADQQATFQQGELSNQGKELDLKGQEFQRMLGNDQEGRQKNILDLMLHPQLQPLGPVSGPQGPTNQAFLPGVQQFAGQQFRVRSPQEMGQIAIQQQQAQAQAQQLSKFQSYVGFHSGMDQMGLGKGLDDADQAKLYTAFMSSPETAKLLGTTDNSTSPGEVFAQTLQRSEMSKFLAKHKDVTETRIEKLLQDPGVWKNPDTLKDALGAHKAISDAMERWNVEGAAARSGATEAKDDKIQKEVNQMAQEILDKGVDIKNPLNYRLAIQEAMKKYSPDAVKKYVDNIKAANPNIGPLGIFLPNGMAL